MNRNSLSLPLLRSKDSFLFGNTALWMQQTPTEAGGGCYPTGTEASSIDPLLGASESRYVKSRGLHKAWSMVGVHLFFIKALDSETGSL